jgi:hypothetical protein
MWLQFGDGYKVYLAVRVLKDQPCSLSPATMLVTLFIFITGHLFWAAQSSSTCRSRSSSGTRKSTGQVAAAWYAGWHSSDFPLQDLSWKKYTMVFYATA